jgi:hypothetical protein
VTSPFSSSAPAYHELSNQAIRRLWLSLCRDSSYNHPIRRPCVRSTVARHSYSQDIHSDRIACSPRHTRPRLHCQLGSASKPDPPCNTNNDRSLVEQRGPEESYLPPIGPSSHNYHSQLLKPAAPTITDLARPPNPHPLPTQSSNASLAQLGQQ